MKIVIFGNGLIGSRVASTLRASGRDVIALARDAGVDTTIGKGIAEAVAGADVVVDLTNSPTWEDDGVMAFFSDSTRHLIAAEEVAGVGHHVILSVVGADRLGGAGYMRAKLAQESLVTAGAIPFSIVRSTQFFEFISDIADAGTVGDTVHATPAHLQPIASRDVASRMADVVTASPSNGTVEIAGPELLGIDDLVRRLFAVTGDARTVATDLEAGYFGAKIDDSALTPTPGADAWIAPTTLSQWLHDRTARAA